jgi:hypothetical protein
MAKVFPMKEPQRTAHRHPCCDTRLLVKDFYFWAFSLCFILWESFESMFHKYPGESVPSLVTCRCQNFYKHTHILSLSLPILDLLLINELRKDLNELQMMDVLRLVHLCGRAVESDQAKTKKIRSKGTGIILVEEGKNRAVPFFGDFCSSVVWLYHVDFLRGTCCDFENVLERDLDGRRKMKSRFVSNPSLLQKLHCRR